MVSPFFDEFLHASHEKKVRTMYDVITIGGATLDIFLDIQQANEKFRIIKDQQASWLSVPYGGKVSVDALHFEVGGNAANVAVGLARLGLHVASYVHYGSDELSQRIKHTFVKEGVATEYMVQDKGEASPISVVINFKAERTLFVHHITRKHVLPALAKPQWLYLTSMGDYWQHLYEQVATYVSHTHVKLAFNPGTHQLKSGVQSFLEEIKKATILFVNKEEALQITRNKEHDMQALLIQLQRMGPNIVSLTDGDAGGYAIDEHGKTYHIKTFPSVPFERTGAGDAYASGFLAAIVNNLSVPTAMQWGSFNAAAVIGTIGAQAGLLTKNDMEKRHTENATFTAVPL